MDYVMSSRPKPKKKSKKEKDEDANQPVDWNQVYEYNRPNDYHEYHKSEDRYRMLGAFKKLIREHAKEKPDIEKNRPAQLAAATTGLSFAPPKTFDPPNASSMSLPPPPPRAFPDAITSDDPYTNRFRVTQGMQTGFAQDALPPPPPPGSPPPPPPPMVQAVKPQPAVISAEPIRYNVPSVSTQAQGEDESRKDSTEGERPKKPVNKALQMMLKMGHVQGKGLGAKQDGIVKPLSLQQEKRKRLPDAQGGGFATPAVGKIVGGTRAKGSEQEDSKFGKPSNVVVVRGLADGVDFVAEMQRDDGGIRQRLGEWLTEKFGNVERLIVHEQTTGDQVPVFIKFTDGFSAMRAVNSFDSLNFEFEGKSGVARYYDADKFEDGVYE
jgi:splicing factor 45